jgi:hypothetical protein
MKEITQANEYPITSDVLNARFVSNAPLHPIYKHQVVTVQYANSTPVVNIVGVIHTKSAINIYIYTTYVIISNIVIISFIYIYTDISYVT